jgi:hypothetical protein
MISTAVRRLNVKHLKAADRDLAARTRPGFAGSQGLPDQGGRREHRMPERTRCLACKREEARTQVDTGTPNMPALPAQWFTAYGALSSASGLFSHRRPPNPGVSGPKADIANSANLIAASGDQDHTLLPSAPARFVVAHQDVHRIPHPTFVTIGRNAPLHESAGRRRLRPLICPTGQVVFWGRKG